MSSLLLLRKSGTEMFGLQILDRIFEQWIRYLWKFSGRAFFVCFSWTIGWKFKEVEEIRQPHCLQIIEQWILLRAQRHFFGRIFFDFLFQIVLIFTKIMNLRYWLSTCNFSNFSFSFDLQALFNLLNYVLWGFGYLF